MPRGWAGAQSSLVELLGKLVEGEIVGGYKFETEPDQRPALGVDDDRADVTAVVAVDVVEVAESGAADGAAVAGLLPHLVGDVGTGFSGLVFVEGREDAVHELADRGVVDRLGGGDQRDALPT